MYHFNSFVFDAYKKFVAKFLFIYLFFLAKRQIKRLLYISLNEEIEITAWLRNLFKNSSSVLFKLDWIMVGFVISRLHYF